MLKNVDGGIEIEEGVQRIAGGVLLRYLLRTRSRRCGIALQISLQIQMPRASSGSRAWNSRPHPVRGVDDRARRQHELQRIQGVIGVLLDAAAHAAGVVGENAAHGAGGDRSRVGPDLGTIRRERVDWRGRRSLPAAPEFFLPASSTFSARQLRATSTSMPSEIDCPDRLVPAARNVMGMPVAWLKANSARISSMPLACTTAFGIRR